MSLVELNHLESELLHLLDFSLFVKEVAYCKYSMQLQNYVFYLEVMPAPRSGTSVLGNMPVHNYCEASAQAAVAQNAYMAQARSMQCGVMTPALLQQSLSYTAPRIPSPDNAHAKACSFSEHYLSANSPLHIAPASTSHARNALLQAQAQVLAQQQAQQAHMLAQRYSQTLYGSQDLTNAVPRTRSPHDYSSYEACLSNFDCDNNTGNHFHAPVGGYFNAFTPAPVPMSVSMMSGVSQRDPMRDSIDESSTTCSTRSASPYPALYSRSASSNMLLSGHTAALTPNVYPAQGVLHHLPAQSVPAAWSGDFVNHSRSRCHSPQHSAMQQGQGYHRSDLSIQTSDLMDVYPLQRSDSGVSVVSVATPYSVYNNHQQSQGQYRQLSPANREAHTPNHHYYPRPAHPVAAPHTPTEHRYQSHPNPHYSFAPAPEVYGYGCAGPAGGVSACEGSSATTPRDYYARPSNGYGGEATSSGYGGVSGAYNTPQRQLPSHFPCPSAMLYASGMSMQHAGLHNVNVNMHGALHDPLNFYGHSAGVNAGQM